MRQQIRLLIEAIDELAEGVATELHSSRHIRGRVETVKRKLNQVKKLAQNAIKDGEKALEVNIEGVLGMSLDEYLAKMREEIKGEIEESLRAPVESTEADSGTDEPPVDEGEPAKDEGKPEVEEPKETKPKAEKKATGNKKKR